jgi:hypothetical protein
MKTLLYIATVSILSCNNQTKEKGNTSSLQDTSANIKAVHKIDNSKYYSTRDTLVIPTEIGDTAKFGKEEFNEIIDNHPELVSDNIQNPDQLYNCSGQKEGFNSEAGQDGYFMLYAYFLKNKNGDKKYSERRKKLIDIYLNINSLFGYFEYGGTYFAHQAARILGYAEFSIYLYKQNEPYGISKTYDITKQKELYIKSLRQLVSDESKIDFNATGQEKIERTKKLNKIVDEIDKAITDNFYLRRVQDFHYGHYEYY